MSDAQGASAPSDTMPHGENASATPETTRAHSGWLIRLLATLGALVFAYVAWTPWAIVTDSLGNARGTSLDPANAIAAGLFKMGAIISQPGVIAAFLVLGPLLAPLLWRPADSLLGAIASHIFGLWVAFATLLVVVFGLTLTRSGDFPAFTLPASHGLPVTHFTWQFALGFWLAAVALVPMWISVVGLLVGEWRRHAFWHLPGNDADAPRSFLQLPGASVLNLGLIIWAIGYLLVGWAASNCNQTPLFFSSCQGIPASSALYAGITYATASVAVTSANDPRILLLLDPNIAKDAMGLLLAGGAVLIFLGVWLRAVTRAFCIWTTLWLALAVVVVGLAYSGMRTLVELLTGILSVQSGVFITLIGLILAVVGLATLSFVALRRRAEE